MVGESYYIQLGPEDRFGWTEPEGKVYQIAADNLVRLKEEIYRVCYLMTQAGGSADDPPRAIRDQQTAGLQHHARSIAGLRRCGEGEPEAGAARDRGGAPG